MEQVVKLVEEVKGKKITASGRSSLSTDAASVSSSSKSASVVVGVDADVLKLQDWLTGMQKKRLEIIPIVGMGGIGKTTLARKLYEDPLIVSHFDTLAWTTISQNYNTHAILSDLGKENIGDWDAFYKSLYGRRYMMVLDDMWSTQVWDEIRMYFPDNNNGSRIVITTRESDVAKCAGSLSLQHEVQLLDKSESWNLLRQIIFEEEDCPLLFQEIGETIARNCRGLPLAIKVIGGILSKVQRSIDEWENIGNDVRAAIAESDEHVQVSNILSLSYNHLPNHLKPCFLYMAAFPEDHKIETSDLIHLWVAEGFINSNIGDKSLEEEAKDCIKALVERNLLLVCRYNNGKPDRYNMHDLLRDLCIKKAVEERFLHVTNHMIYFELIFSNPRRVIYNALAFCSASMPLARSVMLIDWCLCEGPSAWLLELRLLRVLDLRKMIFKEFKFPIEIFQLVNLRYLAFGFEDLTLPVGISRLRNLQTLIAAGVGKIDEPSEIWQLSELRYLKFHGCVLLKYADPNDIVQKNLHTISSAVWLTPSLLESDFFKSIPNIKKLGLYHDSTETYIAVDLTQLHKLEILRCASDGGGSPFLLRVEFPSSLRKLTLFKCAIAARVLTTLCALPNLEVLKIVSCDFEREEWEAAEGDEFRSLQFLHLKSCKLVHWGANETNFPRLRHLCLRECGMPEIPSTFGDITTLQLIVIEYCTDSVVDSAKQIQELQQSDYDNYDLQLRIWPEETDSESKD